MCGAPVREATAGPDRFAARPRVGGQNVALEEKPDVTTVAGSGQNTMNLY
jgi:hypothetical protein